VYGGSIVKLKYRVAVCTELMFEEING
jgi:hypothetical protein